MANTHVPVPKAPPSMESLTAEVQHLNGRIERLEKDWREEHTVIKVLLAAGHVTEHQVEAARSLIHETKE